MNRRDFLAMLAAAARALGTTAPAIPRGGSFEIETGALDPRGGHIQGAAASPEALYLSQMTQLAKFDWSGRLLKKLVDEFHAHNIPVCSIPFRGGKTEEVYFKLYELGCDGFSTDYPSVMFSVIRKIRAGLRE